MTVPDRASSLGGKAATSIRLATEFHALLAEMTGKPILVRYVNEVAYRCGLMLSAFSRPHSSECAVAEHSQIAEKLQFDRRHVPERRPDRPAL